MKVDPISPSTLLKPFTWQVLKDIPWWILKEAASYGTSVMKQIEEYHLSKKLLINDFEPQENAKDIISAIENKFGTIQAVEYYFKNEKWKGFVDVIAGDNLIEIKTRSNDNIRWTDKIQCLIYSISLKKDIWILIWNKKTNSVGKFEKLEFTEFEYERLDDLYKIYLDLKDEKGIYYKGRKEKSIGIVDWLNSGGKNEN